MTTAKTWITGGLATALLMPLAAHMRNGDPSSILSVDMAAIPERGTTLFAMLGETPAGVFQLTLAQLLEEEGIFYFFKHSEAGHDLVLENTPSSPPDVPDAFVLAASFQVHRFPIDSEADGSLRIGDAVAHGPFGDPSVDGDPTAIANMPALPPNPVDPWFAIGTDTGRLILIRSGRRIDHHDLNGPIVDLTVVPQVGCFVFVALVNDRRDGRQHLVGIVPPDNGVPAQIVFDLTDRSGSLVYSSVNVRPPSKTFDESVPVSLMAADGTHIIHRLTIPADPQIGGTFGAVALEGPHVSIGQVAADLRGLALLPMDGSGVLADSGFIVDEGEVSSTLFTIFGNSMEVSPFVYKVAGGGKWTNISLEGHINRAAAIEAGSLVLHAGGRSLPVGSEFTPRLDDADGDGNIDLTIKMDRAAFLSLIAPPSELDHAIFINVTCTWRFVDGLDGFASAVVKVIQ